MCSAALNNLPHVPVVRFYNKLFVLILAILSLGGLSHSTWEANLLGEHEENGCTDYQIILWEISGTRGTSVFCLHTLIRNN